MATCTLIYPCVFVISYGFQAYVIGTHEECTGCKPFFPYWSKRIQLQAIDNLNAVISRFVASKTSSINWIRSK